MSKLKLWLLYRPVFTDSFTNTVYVVAYLSEINLIELLYILNVNRVYILTHTEDHQNAVLV